MSGRHQGVQPGVARSLGWTPEPRRPQSSPIFCTRCGAAARVEVEQFGIGRTLQICDTCGHREFTTTDPRQVAALQRERNDRAARERAATVKRMASMKPWTTRVWEPKTCARVGCGKTFQPKSGNQKYCGPDCRVYTP